MMTYYRGDGVKLDPKTMQPIKPTNPKPPNSDELERIKKSLLSVYPRTTSAKTTDSNILAWALIDTITALLAHIEEAKSEAFQKGYLEGMKDLAGIEPALKALGDK